MLGALDFLRRFNLASVICRLVLAQAVGAVVGYGRAEKKQVITMVTAFLGLREPPKPDDTADALAIAICHGHCASSRIGQFYNN